MQESAVHEHASWPTVVTNAHRYRQIWITRHCGSGRVSQVRCDDRIETRVDYTINARARGSAGMRSRDDVGGIVRITWELLRQQENFLAIVRHFLWTMRVIEGDEVGQRAHVRVRKRREVVRDLRSKFIQQRCELVAVVSKYVPRINVNDSRTEAFHHAQRIFCKRDGQLITRNAAAVIAVIEKARVASDHCAIECVRIEKLRVIAGQLMSKHLAPRRLQHSKQDRDISNAASHRSSRVLLVGNWNYPVL